MPISTHAGLAVMQAGETIALLIMRTQHSLYRATPNARKRLGAAPASAGHV